MALRKVQRSFYSYVMEKITYQNHEIRRWDVGPSTFLASPEKGAQLLNWHINMSDGSVRDVIHWPEDIKEDAFHSVSGGIPILFPFAGKSYLEGKPDYWKLPDGSHRKMPMHGFANRAEFAVRSIDQSGFEVEMLQTEEMKSFYPFDYNFTVIYHFLDLTLQISLVLENESREPIPWSAGLHPYFQVPWRKGLSMKDHKLSIEAKKVFQYKEGGMMVPKDLKTSEQNLNDEMLVNNIFYELSKPKAEISLLNGEENISISEVGGPVTGTRLTFVSWTKPNSLFYCIEPWMSPPNATENKTTRMVAPGARDEFTIEIELS